MVFQMRTLRLREKIRKKFFFCFLFVSPNSHIVAEVGFSPRCIWLQIHTASNMFKLVIQETPEDSRTLEITEKKSERLGILYDRVAILYFVR